MRELGCRWRLLVDEPARPEWNMAVDEALLHCATVPTLRLYRWEPEAVSLGYFQSAEGLEQLDRVVRVRRSTGGGAIFHGRDLTYSVTVPWETPSERLYRFVHGRLQVALEQLGVVGVGLAGSLAEAQREAAERPLFCFDRLSRLDVVANGRKLVGSAQRRRRRRMLQHGTLPRRSDPFSSGGTSLEDELGSEAPAWEQLVDTLRAVWPEAEPGGLQPPEEEAARKLQRRFQSESWLLRRLRRVSAR